MYAYIHPYLILLQYLFKYTLYAGTASRHPTNTPTLTDTSTTTTAAEPQNELMRFYPVISQLEDDFAELSSAVLAHIKSLEEGKLGNLRSFLATFLKPKHSPSASPPSIPKSLDDLECFLIHKWDELQIRVMSGVVNHLQVESLSTQMEAYKQKLAKEIIAFLSCDKRIATYKQIDGHLLVAATIDCNPEAISLKRILELKDYFIYKLGLGEALFPGLFNWQYCPVLLHPRGFCVVSPSLSSSLQPPSTGRMEGGFSVSRREVHH